MASPPVNAESTDPKVAAVEGKNVGSGGFGVWGICDTGHGVHGDSLSSRGVVGTSRDFHGVYGKSTNNVGVAGESNNMHGVLGNSHHPKGAGVFGTNNNGGDGVVGTGRRGVVGESVDFQGVSGKSTKNAGVVGESAEFHAVFGISHSSNNGGVFGVNNGGGWGVIGRSDSNTGVSGESNTGIGVHGKGGRLAGFFEGDIEVTGVIHMTRGDYAEDFTVANPDCVEPGMVMVLDDVGGVRVSHEAYDKRVAGVVSGAGGYKPAVILDHDDALPDRLPLALMGKVYCMVDATDAPVGVGDLLTTSSFPGHAMKALDPLRAFGSVIGKALQPLAAGRGLVPVLVRLQ